MRALWICCSVIPIATNLIVNYVLPLCKRSRVIRHDTRDFLLSLVLATGFAQMMTQLIKNTAGRLRPCFYDMCGWQFDAIWDGSTNLCTNAKWESEARKSFPSGHSSYAWATMFLLTVRSPCILWFKARTDLVCVCLSSTCLAARVSTVKTATRPSCAVDASCLNCWCALRRRSWPPGWLSHARTTTGTTSAISWLAV